MKTLSRSRMRRREILAKKRLRDWELWPTCGRLSVRLASPSQLPSSARRSRPFWTGEMLSYSRAQGLEKRWRFSCPFFRKATTSAQLWLLFRHENLLVRCSWLSTALPGKDNGGHLLWDWCLAPTTQQPQRTSGVVHLVSSLPQQSDCSKWWIQIRGCSAPRATLCWMKLTSCCRLWLAKTLWLSWRNVSFTLDQPYQFWAVFENISCQGKTACSSLPPRPLSVSGCVQSWSLSAFLQRPSLR